MSLLDSFIPKKHQPDWSFQLDAISAVLRDFQKSITGRYLLVLPTGGGKTLTAIRSLSELFNRGTISKDDRILWVVHTLPLHTHAIENLQSEKNYKRFSLNPILKTQVDVKMKAEATRELGAGKQYKLIIIDEAHHSAADTYRELFDYPIGILGLTATPHRMDKQALPFKKISYSITFRELIRRGVVLLPKFLPEVKTSLNIEISSLQDENQLGKFNSQERNELITRYLFQETEKYNFKKVIIFAGTNTHVEHLYEIIKKENTHSKRPFEHIGYIYGGNNNDKNISNENYLKWHHSQASSILINCKILNEGYDDPNIDTVVMATPTNSILYYLQCIGRVVRTPEDYKNAKAYVVEIVDQLPNVSYRIDNRWLFAEISDFLEPTIHDIKGPWPLRPLKIFLKLFSLRAKISDLSTKEITSILLGKRINLLLVNDVPKENFGKWRIWSIEEGNLEKIQMFNEICENIEEYEETNHDYLLAQRYPSYVNVTPFNNRIYRSSLIAALRRAYRLKEAKQEVDSIIYLSIN